MRFVCRLFGVKCWNCLTGFKKDDLVVRALDKIVHLDCFRCVDCRQQLVAGDRFCIHADGLACVVCSGDRLQEQLESGDGKRRLYDDRLVDVGEQVPDEMDQQGSNDSDSNERTTTQQFNNNNNNDNENDDNEIKGLSAIYTLTTILTRWALNKSIYCCKVTCREPEIIEF